MSGAPPPPPATPSPTPAERSTPKSRRGQFARVLLTNFTFFLAFSLFFLIPRFVKQLEGSEDDIGYLMGVGGLASLSTIPLVGVMVDRWGRRPFVLAGCLLMAVANLGFLLLTRMGPLIYALRFLQGAAFAMAFTAAGTLAADLLDPKRRSHGLGLFGATTLITHALGPSAAELITDRWGFGPLFALSAALVAGAAVLAFGIREPEPLAEWPARENAATPSLGSLLMRPGIFAPLLFNLTLGAAFGSILFFLPTYTDQIGLPAVSPFFTAYSLVAVLLRVGAGGLPDRYGRQWFIIPCGLLYCASIYAAVHLHSIFFLVVMGLTFGFSHGFLYPVLNALVVDRSAGGDALGRLMSLFIGGFNAGITAASFAYGLIAEHYGYAVMYRISSLVALAGLLLYVLAEARRRWAHPNENAPSR